MNAMISPASVEDFAENFITIISRNCSKLLLHAETIHGKTEWAVRNDKANFDSF